METETVARSATSVAERRRVASTGPPLRAWAGELILPARKGVRSMGGVGGDTSSDKRAARRGPICSFFGLADYLDFSVFWGTASLL